MTGYGNPETEGRVDWIAFGKPSEGASFLREGREFVIGFQRAIKLAVATGGSPGLFYSK